MIRPRASDVIWDLVCGYAEPVRSRRPLLMLKAYFDDSNIGVAGPYAVLAGWVEQSARWARFADDWESVLRMSPRIEYFKWHDYRGGVGQFHGMSPELALEKVRLLAGVLADYQPLGVASIISNKLHKELFGENPDRAMRDPYFLSFYSVVTQLVDLLSEKGIKDRVDFIFDVQPRQMGAAMDSWERMRDVAPPAAKDIIGYVGFHSDADVKPLQAADLSAGWMREQADTVFSGKPEPEPPWGDRADKIQCLTRIWTVEVYEKLAMRTGAFSVPTFKGDISF